MVRLGATGAGSGAARRAAARAWRMRRFEAGATTASFCLCRPSTFAAVARRLDSYRAASSMVQSSTSARYCRPATWWSMLCPTLATWWADTFGDAVNAAANSCARSVGCGSEV